MSSNPNFPLPGTRPPAIPGRMRSWGPASAVAEEIPELVRIPPHPLAADSLTVLAVECEDLLGYSELRRERKIPGPLARALDKLEIETLDAASVVAYKKRMLEQTAGKVRGNPRFRDVVVQTRTAEVPELRPRIQREIEARRQRENEMMWSMEWRPGSILAVDGAVANNSRTATGALAALEQSRLALLRQMGAYDPFIATTLSSIRAEIAEVCWQCTPLRGYTKPVPTFVLEKARSIARECPGTEFYVEELRVNEHVIDPLGVAVKGDEQVYFEVWDEPQFEATMPHNQV